MFICAIEENIMILCENHAKAFEAAAMVAETPHSIIEMEDEDIDGHTCQACDLHNELNKPRIILPGEF